MNLLMRVCETTWNMQPRVLDQLVEIVLRHDAGVKFNAGQICSAIGRAPRTPNPRDRQYDVHQGVALIPVQGVIHKHAAQVQDVSGPSGTSYEQILADVRMAMADPEVRAALLHVESPGGMSDGNVATSQAITAAAKAAGKPVWTLVDGLGASAAYGVGISGDRVFATPSSQTGSIGTIMVMRDTSAAAEKAGVKTRVVRSAPLKGGPASGEPISDAHLADAQRIVDGFSQQFYQLVADRRGLSGDALAAVTDGRVHLAADALRLGLIDGVASLEQVLAMMTDPTQFIATKKDATRGTTPVRLPSSSPHRAAIASLEQVRAMTTDHTQFKTTPKPPPLPRATTPGAPMPATQNAITATEAKIKELEAAGDKHSWRTLAAKYPELHEAYVQAVQHEPTKQVEIFDISTPAKAIASTEAKIKELDAAGDKYSWRTLAVKYPELHEAYVAAVNAK